jgi:PAS domain S-box-containing protein
MLKDWKSSLRRYALAIGILALIVGVQIGLQLLSIKLSFTIPIIVGLVAASWLGGRGPGFVLAFLMAVISAYSSPPTAGTTQGQWLFTYISNFALMIFIVYVIAERKFGASREHEASERYRQLFQNNPLPMWIYDQETLQITDANRAAADTYGYSRDEFLTMTFKEICPEEPAQTEHSIFDTEVPHAHGPVLVKQRRKDGSLIDVEMTVDELLINHRPAKRVLARDVTERIRNEEARRRSEEQFRRMIEHSSYGKLLIDDFGKIRLINAEIEKQYGYSRDELLGKDLEVLIPERFRRNHATFLSEYKENPTPRSMGSGRELFGLRKDQSEFPVEIGLNPLTDSQETMILATISDITQRKEAENELRRSEERYRELFENNPLPMWVYDANSLAFLAVNDAACRQYGYSSDDFLSMKITQIRPEEEVRNLLDNLETADGSLQKSGDWRHRRKDGSELYVEITSHDIDFLGRKARLVLANDVTDRKNAEEALHRLNESLERRVAERTVELESVNQELEACAYYVSHDLRAPLRAMDGFSLALVEDHGEDLDDTAKNFLSRIRTASQQMSRLIDDLLSLSRVTRSEIKHTNVNLTAIASEIVERHLELQPRDSFVCDIQDEITVSGDERLLRIALENLLGNAWKFTSKTKDARISFQCTGNNGERVYCVKDNGAGFDMRYVDKLFGAFQRLHSANEFEGTGIGLATVQRIIARHGGKIWAESDLGKGAAFYFTI